MDVETRLPPTSDIATALEAAHGKGIVLRNIKPGQYFCDRTRACQDSRSHLTSRMRRLGMVRAF